MPLPLLAILAAVLVEGLAWTFAVPALQGADEGSHFAYVQKIADAHTIPWTQGYTLESSYPPSVSTEQRVAWTWAGLEPLRANPAARPLWTHADERIWAARAARLTAADRRDGGPSQSFKNPPLYYLAAAVPYELAGGSFFDRLWAMRLANLPLLLVCVWLTWLLAGEVFGRRRMLQAVAAGVVGLQPVLLDVASKVTPDVLLAALGSLALYLLARIARRGPAVPDVAGLAVTLLAAGFTHGRGLALVPPAALVVAAAVWRRRRAPAPRRLRALAAVAAGAGLALVYGLYAVSASVRELPGFASYLWQFYLPALPGMSPPVGPPWGASDVYVNRFYSVFGQFDVALPADLESAIRVVAWVVLALLLLAAWRHRRRLADRGPAVTAIVVTALLAILALHAAAFRSLLENPTDPVFTGRYLLMVIPLLGVLVAGALTALPRRLRGAAAGALLAAAALLQLSAFGLVVERFYA